MQNFYMNFVFKNWNPLRIKRNTYNNVSMNFDQIVRYLSKQIVRTYFTYYYY